MSGTAVLILGVMMYLGSFVCIPVENMPCTSFLPDEGKKITAAGPTGITTPASLLSNSISATGQSH